MGRISRVLFVMCLFASRGQAATAATTGLENLVNSGLDFIAHEQIHQPDALYHQGEWPTRVYSSLLPSLIGVGHPLGYDQEPTAFTTASVLNQLAMIYKSHPEFTQVPGLMARGVPSLRRYQEGALYNFYPARMSNGVRVHQSAAMAMLPWWQGFTNVPQDADTTSVASTALVLAAAALGRSYAVPLATERAFARFRDVDRVAQSYDESEGLSNTGAYMTWLYDENDPNMPHYYFASPEQGPRIPFGRNDVDCIVNLNVLRLMALNKRQLAGHSSSCAMLAKVIEKQEYKTCGIYYPNTFNFAYSTALLEQAGDNCLGNQHRKLVDFIYLAQAADGGWYNDGNLFSADRVQATAFAVYALAQFGDARDPEIRRSLNRGADFLFARAKTGERGSVHWEGEVFFTATALARSLVVWRSDSYTTAVSLLALLSVHDQTGWTPHGRSR